MAMQAGLGASKVLILVGAGVGGSIVLRNGKISDLLSDLSRVLSKHLKEDGEGPSGGDGNDNTAAIASQVRRLTMELRQLASSNRPITVVNGSPSSGGNLGSLVVPAAVVGAVGYGYMWLRGWSISDVMYVTRRNMSNAVSSMSKQLETVQSALVTTKRQLTSRLDFMSRSLEDNTTVTNAIQSQVGVICGEVAQVGLEMKDVNRNIEGLEGKIDDVAEKQNLTNQGIALLCRFVVHGLEGSQRAELFCSQKPELLEKLQDLSTTRLERASSTPFLRTSGLKDLKTFSEIFSTKCDELSITGSPALQRSHTITNVVKYLPPRS